MIGPLVAGSIDMPPLEALKEAAVATQERVPPIHILVSNYPIRQTSGAALNATAHRMHALTQPIRAS